jgi:hypothetical protein
MVLPRTHGQENQAKSANVRPSRRGTVKVVATLDEVRPFPSLIWNAVLTQSVSRRVLLHLNHEGHISLF